MIIALPLTETNEFSSHFGAAARAGLFTVDAARHRITKTTSAVPPTLEPCGWADWLGAQGVKVLLAGGIGRGAQERMTAAGITVISGVPDGVPALLVQAWLEGGLKAGPNGCDGGHHAHGHPHHHITTMDTPMTRTGAAAATDAMLATLCAREHSRCFACRPVRDGGLGLVFAVMPDGAVAAAWRCPAGFESYSGIVHGGLLATALDSAMVHALFAQGIVGRTGELTVRYRRSVVANRSMTVTARLRTAYPPLFQLEAEIRQDDVVCVHARAKFMAVNDPAAP